MAFAVEFDPDAWEHIQAFSARDQAIVLDAIEQQLRYQPDQETRNRKSLRANPLAGWELRVRKFRVFYDIVPEEATVYVIAIGIKERNRLLIGGEEFHL